MSQLIKSTILLTLALALISCKGGQGAPGAPGVGALFNVSDEPAGTNCTEGGRKIELGLDNGDGAGVAQNGVLEAGEVDRTSYVCNGRSAVSNVQLKTFGGTSSDMAWAIAADQAGNVYITGEFYGTVWFHPSGQSDRHDAQGSKDIFVTKINADGSYGWTRTFGGDDMDRGEAITVDGSGNVYVIGTFMRVVDFDFGSGTDNHTSNGLDDIFVTKINADGSYGWTRTFGSTNNDQVKAAALDGSGNILITGLFRGTVDFDSGGGVDNITSKGQGDAFLVKINADGSYGWTKTFGGPADDKGTGLARDNTGNFFLIGSFGGTVDFDFSQSTDEKTSLGNSDVFVTKINSDESYGWTRTFGGAALVGAKGVATDSGGNIYVTGFFQQTMDFNFESGTDSHSSASMGFTDAFITKIMADGSYGWTKSYGGEASDEGNGIAIDSNDNLYISGSYQGTVDFDSSSGEDLQPGVSGSEIYVTRINADGSYGWTRTLGTSMHDKAYGVAVDGSDNVYVTGFYQGTAYLFDDWGGTAYPTRGGEDIFVMKISQ